MATSPRKRIAEGQETIDVLRRVHPANHPDAATIAELHEVHAKHEREHGRIENARRASARADRARGKR
jgi:hypothetical protein